MENNHQKPIIGISIGDINGIGPELILRALSDAYLTKICTPVIYGSLKVFSKYKKILDLESIHFNVIENIADIALRKANIVTCWNEDVEVLPGIVTPEAGKCAEKALLKATEDLANGKIDALVTCPINKKNIQSDSFPFIGHTEFFESYFKTPDPLMFMCSNDIKVAVATAHVPIEKVNSLITKELVTKKINSILQSLTVDFAIRKPKIAVLGLNPHAGDQGAIGNQDKDIIYPVIKSFQEKGCVISGPLSADGFFAAGQYQHYDAILAMYHDQGLIPFKMLAFETGVNFTAGLKVVRTSPDHGTAYDLAGKGIADISSFTESILMACKIISNRHEHETFQKTKLQKLEIEREK